MMALELLLGEETYPVDFMFWHGYAGDSYTSIQYDPVQHGFNVFIVAKGFTVVVA